MFYPALLEGFVSVIFYFFGFLLAIFVSSDCLPFPMFFKKLILGAKKYSPPLSVTNP
jgi:uncharacterized membrane protein required for colicin V production